jgi:GTP cyclohydrolase I
MDTNTTKIEVDAIRFADLLEADEEYKNPYNAQIASLIRDLLLALGEDPDRDGLRRTPERVARMYGELLAGYNTDLAALINGAIFESDYQNLVLVRDIEYHSLCEHHMLPFSGKAHVAYIPNGRIIGLSKIPRLVEMFARRLQVQERMTQEIASALQEVLDPKGVAVLAEGSHLCAVMRGVRQPNTTLVTSAMTGVFERDDLRREFFEQLSRSSAPK